jgi:hypothetical protein
VSQKLIQKLRSRGLVPAALVTFALAAALLAPNVGAALRPFLANAYPCTAVSIVATPTTPQPTGTTVTVTASGTCPTAAPIYQFYAKWAGTSTWILQQSYSTSTTWSWNSTGAAAGTETFGVWVRDATSSAAFDAVNSVGYTITALAAGTCTAGTISAAPASPQKASTVITVTATSTCPHAGALYEFWAFWAGAGSWILQQTYSTTATWAWNSTGASAGTETFGVWIKDSGSTAAYDVLQGMPFVITNAACTAVSVTAAPVSPSVHGTTITVTAAGTCPDAAPTYEFWAFWQGANGWILQQAYSTTATWTWNSTGAAAGTEKFGAWVKDAAAAATTPFDAVNSISYVIT